MGGDVCEPRFICTYMEYKYRKFFRDATKNGSFICTYMEYKLLSKISKNTIITVLFVPIWNINTLVSHF